MRLVHFEIGDVLGRGVVMNPGEHLVSDARSFHVEFGEILVEIAGRRGTECQQLLKHEDGLFRAFGGQESNVTDEPGGGGNRQARKGL